MTFKRHPRNRHHGSLVDLRQGEQGILEAIELPADAGGRLMEMGFVPGSLVTAAGSAPGGDPRVYRVDGSDVALRAETAAFLKVRRHKPAGS